jgi:hypothetical protein
VSDDQTLLAPIEGAEHQMFAGLQVDVTTAGSARMKRIVYPPGIRWSESVKPIVGTDYCMYSHVGFLAQGRMRFEFPDGCVKEFTAPQFLVVEPGHDAVVPGDEAAVLIQFDFERDTNSNLGLPNEHTH